MLNLLYILEAPRHNNMPGLLPGCTTKGIEQLPNFLFTGRCDKRVIYPRSTREKYYARIFATDFAVRKKGQTWTFTRLKNRYSRTSMCDLLS